MDKKLENSLQSLDTEKWKKDILTVINESSTDDEKNSMIFFKEALKPILEDPEGAIQPETKEQIKDKIAINNAGILVELFQKVKLSHDSYNFVFKLREKDMVLGICPGQCISVSACITTPEYPKGEEISRKYTPISKIDEIGKFTLLVKIYRRGINPKFPDGGKMTQYLESLQIGDQIRITGPKGKLQYLGLGKTLMKRVDSGFSITKYKSIGMIAGGSGIAPMYQLINVIAGNKEDKTTVNLLFANKTQDDILLRNDLEAISQKGIINLFYTLDCPPKEWNHFSGFVTKDMLMKSMPMPDDDVLICICGPKVMNKLVVGLLGELGHKKENIFKF